MLTASCCVSLRSTWGTWVQLTYHKVYAVSRSVVCTGDCTFSVSVFLGMIVNCPPTSVGTKDLKLLKRRKQPITYLLHKWTPVDIKKKLCWFLFFICAISNVKISVIFCEHSNFSLCMEIAFGCFRFKTFRLLRSSFSNHCHFFVIQLSCCA